MPDIQQKSVQDTVVEAMLNVWAQTKEQHYIPIAGCSMLPLIRDGDSVLITHGCDGVKRGDVVVFRCNGKLVAHRVIGREFDKGSNSVTFITKGDNVFQYDPPVSETEIVGRVLGIRKADRQIMLDTVVWRALGLVIAVGVLTASRLHSRCRDFLQRLSRLCSEHHRIILKRGVQIFFLFLRKIVFFTFCGLR